MHLTKIVGMLILAAFMIGGAGIAVAGESGDTMAAEAEKAIAAAEEAQKMAASVDSEWRDVGKFIKKAKAAAKKGDYGDAIKLANKAKEQSDLGYEQGISQQTLRMPAYLKY
ncbi:MAG TPA: SoxXA-binding protein [Sedimenticola sp.]|nr:SoxXA-binding protein [Sedimenticola sp.]